MKTVKASGDSRDAAHGLRGVQQHWTWEGEDPRVRLQESQENVAPSLPDLFSLQRSFFFSVLIPPLSALCLGEQRSFLSKCMTQDRCLPGKHYPSCCVVLFKRPPDLCAVHRYNMWISKNSQLLSSVGSVGCLPSRVRDTLFTVAAVIVQEGFSPRRTLPPSFSHSPPPDRRAVNAHIMSLWSSCQAGEQMLHC